MFKLKRMGQEDHLLVAAWNNQLRQLAEQDQAQSRKLSVVLLQEKAGLTNKSSIKQDESTIPWIEHWR